jgi:hypothetical protein
VTEADRVHAKARKIIAGLLHSIPDLICEDFHHQPKDYHRHDEECPLMKRCKDAKEAARKFVYNEPD